MEAILIKPLPNDDEEINKEFNKLFSVGSIFDCIYLANNYQDFVLGLGITNNSELANDLGEPYYPIYRHELKCFKIIDESYIR